MTSPNEHEAAGAKSFPAYPEYKNSGIEWLGEVPAHWEVTPVRAFVEERTAKNANGDEESYLSLIANVGVIPYAEKGDVGNKKPDDLSKCKKVDIGDLVINSMNYGIGSYGLSGLKGVCSPVYIVLRPVEKKILPRYALRIFENKEFQKLAQSFGQGILAHRSAIGWDDLKNIKVPLPENTEQAQLSAFLDHETARIDALIAEQKRLIALLKEKRQAVISHAVTKGLDPDAPMKDSGVEWLGDVPAHWEVKRLRYVVELNPSKMEVRALPDERSVSFIPMEAVGEDGGLRLEQTRPISEVLAGYTYVREGDVTIAKITPCFENGKGAVMRGLENGVGFGTTELIVMRPKAELTTSDYLYQVVSSEPFRVTGESSMYGAGGQKRVPDDFVRNFTIAWPPYNEQLEIQIFLDREAVRIDALLNESQQGIDLLQERRSALISAAVTGKIDVRGWQASVDPTTYAESGYRENV